MGPGMRAGGDRTRGLRSARRFQRCPGAESFAPVLKVSQQVARNPGRAAELDLDLRKDPGSPFYVYPGAQLCLDPKSGHLLGLEWKHVPTCPVS